MADDQREQFQQLNDTFKEGFDKFGRELRAFTTASTIASSNLGSDVKSMATGVQRLYSDTTTPVKSGMAQLTDPYMNRPASLMKDIGVLSGINKPYDMREKEAVFYANKHMAQRGEQLKEFFSKEGASTALSVAAGFSPLGLTGAIATEVGYKMAYTYANRYNATAEEKIRAFNSFDRAGQMTIRASQSKNDVTFSGWGGEEAERLSGKIADFQHAEESNWNVGLWSKVRTLGTGGKRREWQKGDISKIYETLNTEGFNLEKASFGDIAKNVNIDDYEKKIKTGFTQVKKIMQFFHTTQVEAAQTLATINQLGIKDIDNAMNTIKIANAYTGFTSQQILEYSQNVGQQMQGAAMGAGYTGGGLSANVYNQIGMGAQARGENKAPAIVAGTGSFLSDKNVQMALIKKDGTTDIETMEKLKSGDYTQKWLKDRALSNQLNATSEQMLNVGYQATKTLKKFSASDLIDIGTTWDMSVYMQGNLGQELQEQIKKNKRYSQDTEYGRSWLVQMLEPEMIRTGKTKEQIDSFENMYVNRDKYRNEGLETEFGQGVKSKQIMDSIKENSRKNTGTVKDIIANTKIDLSKEKSVGTKEDIGIVKNLIKTKKIQDAIDYSLSISDNDAFEASIILTKSGYSNKLVATGGMDYRELVKDKRYLQTTDEDIKKYVGINDKLGKFEFESKNDLKYLRDTNIEDILDYEQKGSPYREGRTIKEKENSRRKTLTDVRLTATLASEDGIWGQLSKKLGKSDAPLTYEKMDEQLRKLKINKQSVKNKTELYSNTKYNISVSDKDYINTLLDRVDLSKNPNEVMKRIADTKTIDVQSGLDYAEAYYTFKNNKSSGASIDVDMLYNEMYKQKSEKEKSTISSYTAKTMADKFGGVFKGDNKDNPLSVQQRANIASIAKKVTARMWDNGATISDNDYKSVIDKFVDNRGEGGLGIGIDDKQREGIRKKLYSIGKERNVEESKTYGEAARDYQQFVESKNNDPQIVANETSKKLVDTLTNLTGALKQLTTTMSQDKGIFKL